MTQLLAGENFIQFSRPKSFTLYNMYNYLTFTSYHILSLLIAKQFNNSLYIY